MADVDFGDTELFQQFDDFAPPVSTHIRFTENDEEQEETSLLRSRLEENNDYIQRLIEENILTPGRLTSLRRKLNVLERPSGIIVEDANVDGPILQILYINNCISKQCRQEVEDYIRSIILKHQSLENKRNNSSSHLKPQNSAFTIDEDPQKSPSSSERKTGAFDVVGSVQYFSTFCVDKVGQPLLNENPQLTDGWEVPPYNRVFNRVLGSDGLEIDTKDKRPKSLCFNCGLSTHQLRDCPKPKDMAAINERRKEANQTMQSNHRYHDEGIEERFSKYKPGVLSEELLAALGIDGNTLPPLVYRMRQLGYPPGWLKEAEMENSGLTLYDGTAAYDSNTTNNTSTHTSYDVSKLVDFPGFNVPAPHHMKDEFMMYNSVPMQSCHMKQNYAAYLSNNFAAPGASCNKRRHESESPQQPRKRARCSPDRTSDRSSDMDIESDPGMPYFNQGPGDFHFQPPLPPGSPSFSSPPPLPHGTPPATPTPPPLPKGTPPPTPTNGSPALRGQSWAGMDETVQGTEDDLTLEELEEQQRLIWAALENADTATSSDSETPVVGTPIHSSPSVHTPAYVDTETEEMEESMDKRPAETSQSSDNQREHGSLKVCPQSPGSVRSQDVSPRSPGPCKSHDDSPQSPVLVKSPDGSLQSPVPGKSPDGSLQSPVPGKSQDGSLHSPVPGKSQDGSLQSPVPIKFHDNSPQSPGPVKSQDDSPQSPGPVKSQDDSPQSPGPVKSQEDSPQSPGPIKSKDDSPQSPGPVKSQDDSPQSPGPVKSQDDSPQSPGPIKSHNENPQSPDPDPSQEGVGDFASVDANVDKVIAVPHRSKFAVGIVPFEETPEYTEVAKATGTYLKIRDLLKGSPRSLARKK
ncbi:zinc finger CCHC domain-containing protein 8 [Aulostomus maculatus]